MSKHSPLPWTILNETDIFSNRVKGQQVAECLPDGIPYKTALANADFIVKAVNGLPELVELIQAVIDDSNKPRFSWAKWGLAATKTLKTLKAVNEEVPK